MKRISFSVLAVWSMLLSCQALVAQCVEVTDEAVDYEFYPESRVIHAKKIEYALSVISDQQYLKDNQQCVAKALFFLGQFHVEQAMPRMIELLSYEHKVVHPFRGRMRNEEYPAIGGLAGVGKPAIPALLKVVSGGETPLERENALYAFMTIYGGRPVDAIGVLHKTADAEQDTISAGHLREAAAKAETIWCKAPGKCANAAD